MRLPQPGEASRIPTDASVRIVEFGGQDLGLGYNLYKRVAFSRSAVLDSFQILQRNPSLDMEQNARARVAPDLALAFSQASSLTKGHKKKNPICSLP